MPMQPETIRCLERVEAALDPAHLARTHQLWEDCRHYRPVSHLPTVVCCPAPDWPQYSMAEIQSVHIRRTYENGYGHTHRGGRF